MKISEATIQDIAEYLRLENGEYNVLQLESIMSAAKKHIESYTGIPASSVGSDTETLDDYDDLYIAYLVLCQDMYDNRSMYPDCKYENNANRVIDTILGMHRRNLL